MGEVVEKVAGEGYMYKGGEGWVLKRGGDWIELREVLKVFV